MKYSQLLLERDQKNGTLIKFFLPNTLAKKIEEYKEAHEAAGLGFIGRDKILYKLAEGCLDEKIEQLRQIAAANSQTA